MVLTLCGCCPVLAAAQEQLCCCCGIGQQAMLPMGVSVRLTQAEWQEHQAVAELCTWATCHVMVLGALARLQQAHSHTKYLQE